MIDFFCGTAGFARRRSLSRSRPSSFDGLPRSPFVQFALPLLLASSASCCALQPPRELQTGVHSAPVPPRNPPNPPHLAPTPAQNSITVTPSATTPPTTPATDLDAPAVDAVLSAALDDPVFVAVVAPLFPFPLAAVGPATVAAADYPKTTSAANEREERDGPGTPLRRRGRGRRIGA